MSSSDEVEWTYAVIGQHHDGSPKYPDEASFLPFSSLEDDEDLPDIYGDDLAIEAAKTLLSEHDGFEESWPVDLEIRRNGSLYCRRTVSDVAAGATGPHPDAEEFDPDRETSRRRCLSNQEIRAENRLDRYDFTPELSLEECEIWLCAEPGRWDCSFRLMKVRGAMVVAGDIGSVVFRPGYDISWLSRQRPCQQGRGYLESKVLCAEQPTSEGCEAPLWFVLSMATKAARRIEEIKSTGGPKSASPPGAAAPSLGDQDPQGAHQRGSGTPRRGGADGGFDPEDSP